MRGVTAEPRYLCHECGTELEARAGSKLLWCPRCDANRRKPTEPALVVWV